MIVFISYSNKRKIFIDLFINELMMRDKRIQYWQDVGNITYGEDWQESIDKAIDNCDVFLLFLDRDSVSSKYVAYELGYAKGKGKRIIPVLFETCKKPPQVVRLQHVDFRRSASSLDSLIKSILYSEDRKIHEEDFEANSFKIGGVLREEQ